MIARPTIAKVRKRLGFPEVSPEIALLAYRLAYVGLIVGAGIVLASTLVNFWSDSEIKRHDDLRLSANERATTEARAELERSKERIAELAIQGDELRKQTAEANARAAEAQLALEKFKAPRRLTADQKVELIERMRPFSGSNFAMAGAGAESIDFAMDISEPLKQAGWQWINWPLGGIAIRPSGGRPEMGFDVMRGIETHIYDDALKPLAVELFQALTAAGHKNQWVLLPAAKAGHEKTVIIIIGSKE